MTRLSVIILSWNTKDLLEACLHSLFLFELPMELEVLVVDNDSGDGSPDMVDERFPAVRLIRNERNEGYARGNNLGIRECTGDFLLLLNSDTEVKDGALEAMIRFLEAHEEYGGCGAQLLNPDGTIQPACMRFPGLGATVFFDTFLEQLFPRNPLLRRYFMRDFDHTASRDVDQPPGACFMIRREVVDRIGLLDEDLFLFYNDVDFCKRMWGAGFKIRFLADAKVLHHGGASTKHYRDFGLEWHRNRVRYYRKHYGLLGAFTAKSAALVKAAELILRSGKGLGSHEGRMVLDTLKDVMKT